MKPTIRRVAPGRWQLSKPLYGFSDLHTATTEHPTWRAALAAVAPRFAGGGGSLAERSTRR